MIYSFARQTIRLNICAAPRQNWLWFQRLQMALGQSPIASINPELALTFRVVAADADEFQR